MVSLLVLREFPTSKTALKAGLTKLTDRIACLCPKRSENWASEKAKAILVAASNNPFQETAYSKVEEFMIIQSIPGIGGKIAAMVLSEIGEVT